MADFAALIERLEALTGPDREVDALIFETLVHAPIKEKVGGRHFDDLPKEMQLDISNRVWSNRNYTASLDTAIALVEQELPGWHWNVGEFPTVRAQLAQPVETKFGPGIGIRADTTGATPAIALCIALLRAKGGDNG